MTATDTELVKYVFNSVAEIVLNEILRETGLNMQKHQETSHLHPLHDSQWHSASEVHFQQCRLNYSVRDL